MPHDFDRNDDFTYDQHLAARNFGADVQVHLGVGTAGGPGAIDIMLDHNDDFYDYLREEKRVPFLVPDYTVGVLYREDGSAFVNNFWVVISKPAETAASFDLDEALAAIPAPAY